jgi:hypothetical protein
MGDAINAVGGGMPFDMGDMPDMAQNGLQTDANVSSVRMFSPDDAGGMGDMTAGAQQGPLAAANDGGGAKGTGAKGGGADMAGAISQIMDIIKSAMSAAMPLLGMVTSLMGKAGAAGGGAA